MYNLRNNIAFEIINVNTTLSVPLCRQNVPNHKVWFQKVAKLEAKALKQKIERRGLNSLPTTY